MSERLLHLPQLRERGIEYHRAHLGRLERAGQFPRRVELMPGGRVAWLESDVDRWIEERTHPVVRRVPQRGRKVVALDEEVPPGMLRCGECGGLFRRTVGKPPKRCAECRA